MSNYSKADTRSQWYADNYPGSRIAPNCGVLHTTEGPDWPTYSGGAVAPTYTAKPDIRNKRLVWRAHFPDEMSARALRNESGGVNTNTANAIQVELVGTCDDRNRTTWGGRRAGVDYLHWPTAPDWALRELADFITDMNRRHGIKIQGPKMWLAYGADTRRPGVTPASYGASPARMTFAEWRGFYGWCGHQHVPENSHGDPGDLEWAKVEQYARELVAPPKPDPTPPEPPKPEPPAPSPEPTTPPHDPFTVALLPGRWDAPLDAWMRRHREARDKAAEVVTMTEGTNVRKVDLIINALAHLGWEAYHDPTPGPANIIHTWDPARFERVGEPWTVKLTDIPIKTPTGFEQPDPHSVGIALKDKVTGGVILLVSAHLPLENTDRRRKAKEAALAVLKDKAFDAGRAQFPEGARMFACDWNRRAHKKTVRDWFASVWPGMTAAWATKAARTQGPDWVAAGTRLSILDVYVLPRAKGDPLDHTTKVTRWGWR